MSPLRKYCRMEDQFFEQIVFIRVLLREMAKAISSWSVLYQKRVESSVVLLWTHLERRKLRPKLLSVSIWPPVLSKIKYGLHYFLQKRWEPQQLLLRLQLLCNLFKIRELLMDTPHRLPAKYKTLLMMRVINFRYEEFLNLNWNGTILTTTE